MSSASAPSAAGHPAARQARAVASAMSEEKIQAAVIQHLELRSRPGVVFWHTPNGGWRRPAEAGRFKALGVRAGMPDLMLLANGQLFGLELKAAGGKLSPSQIEAHEAMRAAGATVETATGLDAALEALERWNLFRCRGMS